MDEQRRGLGQPARTLLEQLIKERQLTFEEFAEYAEAFARDHGETGTLSVRHLQRLVAGRRADGTPLGPVRPATARLLEGIFDRSIGSLLSSTAYPDSSGKAHALRVAIAVVVRGLEVLIVHRRVEDAGRVSWQFPAGIVKPGGQPRAVAIRETLEETGVHCRVARELGSRLHPTTNVYCEYLLCDYLAGEAMNSDQFENLGVTWIKTSKLTLFIPAHHIYGPVLRTLGLSQE